MCQLAGISYLLNAGAVEGENITMSHLLTSGRVELRGSFVAQKIAKNRTPTGKILRNSNLLSKKVIPKNMFF